MASRYEGVVCTQAHILTNLVLTGLSAPPPVKSRTETAEQLIQSLGPRAAFIPSSNHADIMAGQGTIALEMLEQVCT